MECSLSIFQRHTFRVLIVFIIIYRHDTCQSVSIFCIIVQKFVIFLHAFSYVISSHLNIASEQLVALALVKNRTVQSDVTSWTSVSSPAAAASQSTLVLPEAASEAASETKDNVGWESALQPMKQRQLPATCRGSQWNNASYSPASAICYRVQRLKRLILRHRHVKAFSQLW